MKDMLSEKEMNDMEDKILGNEDNSYAIYQIKHGSKGEAYQFWGMSYVEEKGLSVDASDYNIRYVCEWKGESLDDIFTKFNVDRPEDFKGHSLSVSDVIVTRKDGNLEAYYVDSFGFAELPDFVEQLARNAFFNEHKGIPYHSSYTGETMVAMDIQQYMDTGNMYIGLGCFEDGYPEPFGDLTVNLGDVTPNYCSYVDVNNMPNAEKFIKDNGLGSFTGFIKRSGYVEYPLYMFEPDKLREFCPDGLALYEKSKGIQVNVQDKKEKR